MEMGQSIRVFGVRFDNVTLEEAHKRFSEWMGSEDGQTFSIYTPNPEFVMRAQEDLEFKETLNQGDLVLADGVGIVLASRIHHLDLKGRVTGIDMMEMMLEYCNRAEKSIYLFGGKPGVASAAAERIAERYPNVTVSGHRDGYYDVQQELAILDAINGEKPDVVFVGLGSPKQEFWIQRHKKLLNARVVMGIGGALDVWSGMVKRAPRPFQKMGLEWLYRLFKQPTRFKRMMVLPKFMIKVLISKNIDA